MYMYADREAMKRRSNVLLSTVTAETPLELEGVKQENKERVRLRLRLRVRL